MMENIKSFCFCVNFVEIWHLFFFSLKHQPTSWKRFLTMFLCPCKHPIIKGNILLYFFFVISRFKMNFHTMDGWMDSIGSDCHFSRNENRTMKKLVRIIFFIRNNWKKIENTVFRCNEQYLQQTWSIPVMNEGLFSLSFQFHSTNGIDLVQLFTVFDSKNPRNEK